MIVTSATFFSCLILLYPPPPHIPLFTYCSLPRKSFYLLLVFWFRHLLHPLNSSLHQALQQLIVLLPGHLFAVGLGQNRADAVRGTGTTPGLKRCKEDIQIRSWEFNPSFPYLSRPPCFYNTPSSLPFPSATKLWQDSDAGATSSQVIRGPLGPFVAKGRGTGNRRAPPEDQPD